MGCIRNEKLEKRKKKLAESKPDALRSVNAMGHSSVD
jgi:hypothetical protein